MTAVYAHRGNVAFTEDDPSAGGRTTVDNPWARENTLEAFDAAPRAGADGVGLDVRLSADDLPVIQHDRRLPDGRDVANIDACSLPAHVPLVAATRAEGIGRHVWTVNADADLAAMAALGVAAVTG